MLHVTCYLLYMLNITHVTHVTCYTCYTCYSMSMLSNYRPTLLTLRCSRLFVNCNVMTWRHRERQKEIIGPNKPRALGIILIWIDINDIRGNFTGEGQRLLFIHAIHSGYFYSASSSPILLKGAPDTARILCWNFTPKRHRQLRVKDLYKVPTWRMERDLNLRPFGRKAPNLRPQSVGTGSWGASG